MNTPAATCDTVGDWLDLVDRQWPWATAAEWDNVGLQVGDPTWSVCRVVVALDVTAEVVAEAATEPDTLVLAHHPLLFRPLETLTPSTASGRTALGAARSGVAVAAAHTNLDIATDGVGTSDPVVAALGLVDVAPLTRQDEPALVKLVTFVPTEHRRAMVDAVTATGAGTIGDYTRCTFATPGTGTFLPGDDADPHVGAVGADAQVDEVRLELQLPAGLVSRAVAALEGAHPYEEVPVDLYDLRPDRRASLGRRGRLPTPMPLHDLAITLRDALPSPHLRAAGDPTRRIETVAVVGGAGDSMIPAALAAGVDCLVTGDLRHHVTLDAVADGLAMVDAGHHAVEHAAMDPWIKRLQGLADDRGLVAPVVASTIDTQPWLALGGAGA